MKANKQLATRVGVVIAVLVIVYCMFKLRSCKDTYAELAYDNYYEEPAEEEYEEEAQEQEEYEEEDDYYSEDGGEGYDDPYTLMESTMDDAQANAMFQAGA